ncbi:MAG: repeat/Tetratricopeptide repeat, partial [Frankiales bacterium]|nr:repeat/Tetratricopeptide repeat [Frankiales bacterium]
MTHGLPTPHPIGKRIAVGGCTALLLVGVSACSNNSGKAQATPGPSASGGTSALLNQALTDQAQGKNAQAKAEYQQLLAQDPNNKFAFYNLGAIAQIEKDNALAITYYNRTLAVDPKFNPALYNLAIITDATGNPNGAVSLYRRAIASNPTDAKAHYNLGLLLRRLGKVRDGVAEIN